MENNKKTQKVDLYIQLFECIQELLEQHEKMTYFQRQDIDKRLGSIIKKTYNSEVSENIYKIPLKNLEKLLNHLAELIEISLLNVGESSFINSKIEKVQYNVEKIIRKCSFKLKKEII